MSQLGSGSSGATSGTTVGAYAKVERIPEVIVPARARFPCHVRLLYLLLVQLVATYRARASSSYGQSREQTSFRHQ